MNTDMTLTNVADSSAKPFTEGVSKLESKRETAHY